MPIYVLLVLSLYFNGESGSEQVKNLPGINVVSHEAFKRIDVLKLNQHLGLFHPNSGLENYQNLISSSCLKVQTNQYHGIDLSDDILITYLKKIRSSQLPQLATLIIFHHQGLSSFQNGIMISKYWRKFLFEFDLNLDIPEILEKCTEMAKYFMEHICWLKNLNSQTINFQHHGYW